MPDPRVGAAPVTVHRNRGHVPTWWPGAVFHESSKRVSNRSGWAIGWKRVGWNARARGGPHREPSRWITKRKPSYRRRCHVHGVTVGGARGDHESGSAGLPDPGRKGRPTPRGPGNRAVAVGLMTVPASAVEPVGATGRMGGGAIGEDRITRTLITNRSRRLFGRAGWSPRKGSVKFLPIGEPCRAGASLKFP